MKLIKIDDETVTLMIMFSTLDQLEAARQTLHELVITELGRFASNPPEVLLGDVLWEVRW